jgi:RNA polymerase sigma-70 factor (ECF subfamily)
MSMDVPHADSELYERARTGDAAALDRLLGQYLPQLHAFVRLRLHGVLRARESSMDVVQSVCRELLSAGRFEFRGEDRFRAWLFTSALNKLRDKHRFYHYGKRDVGREVQPDDDLDLRAVASFLTPSAVAIGKETARALQEALDAISDEHREVVTLARVVGLPHQVIAEVMGRNEVAVRQLLARALVKLSMELRARGVDLV